MSKPNYRLRTFDVEAKQIKPGNLIYIAKWLDAYEFLTELNKDPDRIKHHFLIIGEDSHFAYEGDWIVKYPDGKIDVFTSEEFRKKFVEVFND